MQNTAKKATLPATALAALGVVFGDIGTSPLYALKESFHAAHGLGIQPENVLGILSIIFWCLMLIISIKYVAIVMRADNNGEGGIMALLALNLRKAKIADNKKIYMIAIGFIGASLFFGDGIITPAISVLSAVEGLSIATDVFDPFIMPIAITIIIALFLVQKHGTAFVGKFFGPITMVWFLSLGLLGLHSVIQTPVVLGMFSPHWAIQFIYHNPVMTFFVMGAVVLTVTGGEALYADMGHFGPIPIRLAWFIVVLPCLVLNYAGQGALLLRDPAAIQNPFYLLVPQWALYPMIIMATMATVIASQAVISGVFSLARQAIQLGYLPRLSIKHTSESEEGQIYVPFLNWLLLIAIIILILIFKTSSNLASAYGLAVTLTMLCDTILVAVFIYSAWKWSMPKVLLLIIPFFVLESVLVAATSLKILSGGWVPLLIGAIAVTILMTWKRGRELTFAKLEHDTLSLDLFVKSIGNSVHWVPGDAVFMTGTPNVVPHAMLHNIKHNKVLHQRNILVTVVIEDVPFVEPEDRISTETLAEHFFRIKIFYGFKDEMNVPKALMQAYEQLGLEYDLMHISFFISRDRIVHSVGDGMSPWREKLFISMQRNTSPVSDFYQIPTNRVVELGSQIEI
ncbi:MULTISPECIES: potassium transporter Kup [Acinetobacter]|uniref:potassium transporter Kup n=1 Tax=Acinetobacter TaxID=469 RepID=UPI00124CAF0D|nr:MULTISPECIES: potassium transporter Kup [Acinetobacter]MBP2604528.1 KUP system potassium uptake protein [Acinetobacter calcoaceticus]MDS7934088.1 potassium transporter Kup [Acinetobacter sp. V91_4B]MDS7962426.1 potassium transporter Kup [Acinetobacter sp. V91_7]MDS8026786.1 potassium transporter Kup [Acinetobacter sp. V91_13]